MKVYLGIDTATPNLVLGLYSPVRGVLGVYEDGLEPHATKQLILQLDKLLQQSRVDKNDIAGITVGVGPGSYTGIKVAIATAKGLAKGLDIPLQGKSTLAAIAFSVLKDQELGIITLDARRENVYYGVYKKNSGQIKVISAEKKVGIKELKSLYPKMQIYADCTPSPEYLASQYGFEKGGVEAIYL